MNYNKKVRIVSTILFFACLTSVGAKVQKANGIDMVESDLQSTSYGKVELVSSNVNRSEEISKEKEMKNVAMPFETISFKVSNNETINWTVKSEQGVLPYLVEQFIFDRWVTVGEVKGNGLSEIQVYSVPVVMNSGDNKIRVHQKGTDGKNHFSKVIHFYCSKKQVIYTLAERNSKLQFSFGIIRDIY